MKGKIHSIETFGTVDGPGIRYVIFVQGCNFRCAYCHNPDTWEYSGGSEYTTDELLEDICRYKRYIEGVTISGGEPLLQIDFVTELFEKVKAAGLTTCIDTNGGIFDKNNDVLTNKINKMLEFTDLVMLDIKHIDEGLHTNLTGHTNSNVLEFARFLSDRGQDMWLRYVLVPTINDSVEHLTKWRDFADSLISVDKIEVLPYHTLAVEKYEKLGLEYKLKDISEPTKEQIEQANNILNEKRRDKK